MKVILYNGTQSVNGFPHVGISTGNVDIVCFWNVTQHKHLQSWKYFEALSHLHHYECLPEFCPCLWLRRYFLYMLVWEHLLLQISFSASRRRNLFTFWRKCLKRLFFDFPHPVITVFFVDFICYSPYFDSHSAFTAFLNSLNPDI